MFFSSFKSYSEIESKYPIILTGDTKDPYEKEVIDIYNGHANLNLCQQDSTGLLYNHLGNYEKFVRNNEIAAVRCYGKSCEKNCIIAYVNLADYVEDIERKISLLEKAIVLGGTSSILYFKLIETYMCVPVTEERENRVARLIQLIMKKCDEPHVIVALGQIFVDANDIDTAGNILLLAKKLFDQNTSSYKCKEGLSRCNYLLIKLCYAREVMKKKN